MKKYFLVTQRLGFRFWTPGDLPVATALWGNPEVTRLFSRDPLTEAQVKERLDREIDNARLYGIQYWPIFMLEHDRFVGCCGLRPYQADTKTFELGYHLLPDSWGLGIATEAAGAVINHAFSVLRIQSLCAGHHPDNHASGRVLMKLDFMRIGETFFEPTGLNHPAYLLKNPFLSAFFYLK